MFPRWPVCVLTIFALFAGCAESPPPSANQTPTGGPESTAAVTLSPEDQALADKQKVCPVGGEALGSMGTPIKMMVGDRAVFLCCEGCRGAVEKDPEKYLAKLDAPAASPAEPAPTATTEAGTPAAEAPATPVSEAPANP